MTTTRRPMDEGFLMTPEDRRELLQSIMTSTIQEPVEDLPTDPRFRIGQLVTRRNALVVGLLEAQKDGDLTAVARLRNAVIHTNAQIDQANVAVKATRPVISKRN